jgi:hypothetical protein
MVQHNTNKWPKPAGVAYGAIRGNRDVRVNSELAGRSSRGD